MFYLFENIVADVGVKQLRSAAYHRYIVHLVHCSCGHFLIHAWWNSRECLVRRPFLQNFEGLAVDDAV